MLEMVKIDSIRYVEANLISSSLPTSVAATSGTEENTMPVAVKQNNAVESQTPTEVPTRDKHPISKDKVRLESEQMNRFLQLMNTHLSFMIDEDSEMFVVRLIDTETSKVIKQIPPEEFLKTVAKIKSMIGAIIDEMV